jgi:hypothetical protein
MRVRPRGRLSLCFKKSVDHDGPELVCSPSTKTSRFATNDRRFGVDLFSMPKAAGMQLLLRIQNSPGALIPGGRANF